MYSSVIAQQLQFSLWLIERLQPTSHSTLPHTPMIVIHHNQRHHCHYHFHRQLHEHFHDHLLFLIFHIVGVCNVNFNPPKCTDCIRGWMGAACEVPCVNGVQNPMDSGVCKCNPCYSGRSCNSLCSNHGSCLPTGICQCDFNGGWRGDLCEIPGCPGIKTDCSSNGICNSEMGMCICYPGWTGVGCHIPDCPGNPNCFGRGYCNATGRLTPECTDCIAGWMGPACNDPCVHGSRFFNELERRFICRCDSCHTGMQC